MVSHFLLSGAFHGLANVDNINLDVNSLTTIASDTFRFTNKYNYLSLGANYISSIEVGAFVLPTDTSKLVPEF